MKKIFTLTVETPMANRESDQWIRKAVDLQLKHDPAHRELKLLRVKVQKAPSKKK